MSGQQNIFVLQLEPSTPAAFVEYWKRYYNYENESLYDTHIDKPLTPNAIHDLFLWKNGGKLSKAKQASVERNYIARLSELETIPEETTAKQFLDRFNKGGAIWRIFFLHCWRPNRFPIYDQHVHRAAAVINTGGPEEITAWSDKRKVEAYLSMYFPWHEEFIPANTTRRDCDRALWAFGRLIKIEPQLGT